MCAVSNPSMYLVCMKYVYVYISVYVYIHAYMRMCVA